MCEYIDRIGKILSKDTNKRKKSGEQYKIEKLNVSKTRHEVSPASSGSCSKLFMA
jgi:hypothetical protein